MIYSNYAAWCGLCNLMIFDVTCISSKDVNYNTIIPSASASFIICHSWPCGGSWSSCHVSVVPHWRWTLIADDSSTAWRCHRPDFVKTTGMVAVYQPTRLLSDKFYTSRSQESCLPEPIPAIQTTDNDSERTCTGRAVEAVDAVSRGFGFDWRRVRLREGFDTRHLAPGFGLMHNAAHSQGIEM